MSIKPKALVSFSGMKDDELMVAAKKIIRAMTDNLNYPAPTPDLAVLQDLSDDYTVKLLAARKRGSPEDTALKDEAKPVLADALQKLGYYVNTVAQGRLSTLLSSGFPTNSTQATSMIPLKVEGLRLADGRQSGQMRLDFAPARKMRMYEYRYRKVTDEGTEPWSDRYTTTSSRGNIIAPLEPGKVYQVQVRAINTQGPGDWSNSASLLVR